MMKWDVKHDRAKRVIDAFLENAGYWQEREDLAEGLTDEEKGMVNEEVGLMIDSIRKRYKLDVRLPMETIESALTQKAEIGTKNAEAVISTEKTRETFPEPINEDKGQEKPKRTRKVQSGEKKPATTRKKRYVHKEEQ